MIILALVELASAPQIEITLDFGERDLVAGAVVEFGRARALVRRHGLSIPQGAVFEIGSDVGRAEIRRIYGDTTSNTEL